ncbi:hypothetical protein [Pontibacillus marinus]|uniref:Uncharacterized protein n=1 Tax=Pontibacillus marinus BH030004 = DSM 16465 TaxID=1385511 RepID=A0A0A5GG29_9BACI|nr:hypothetical protein [Pontibacillus marinus]KGX90178.1 hypothetical protein N783_01415 [Pontibacillus marinus BH030004 = DSM 16465]
MVNCQSISCNNRVPFCCQIIVPAHLDIVCTPPEITFDPNCLTTIIGTCEESIDVTDPCNSEQQIECNAELTTISAVGSIPYLVAIEVQNSCEQITYLCCQDTVCVNQVMNIKCPEEDQLCFINECEISIDADKEIMDSELCVDEQIVTIQGEFILPPCI